jgi:hypothetical protein
MPLSGGTASEIVFFRVYAKAQKMRETTKCRSERKEAVKFTDRVSSKLRTKTIYRYKKAKAQTTNNQQKLALRATYHRP